MQNVKTTVTTAGGALTGQLCRWLYAQDDSSLTEHMQNRAPLHTRTPTVKSFSQSGKRAKTFLFSSKLYSLITGPSKVK